MRPVTAPQKVMATFRGEVLTGGAGALVRDVTFRVAPFGLDTARRMIGELRAASMFEGVRGKPARDLEALAQALVRIGSMAWVLRDRIAEIDINPLLVRTRGAGVVAADALIVLR